MSLIPNGLDACCFRIVADYIHLNPALASLLRERTSVGNGWIAARLAMGHPGSVSRMLGVCKRDKQTAPIRKALVKELSGGAA